VQRQHPKHGRVFMKKILCTIFFATGLTFTYAQWNEITSPYAGNLSAIKFFDSNTGYIGANTAILKTTDGGDSWDTISLGVFSINNFSFPSSTVGYFGANNGMIAKTTDQGANWVTQDLGVSPYAFLALSFPTLSVGYAVGSAGIIRKTTDSGATWTPQILGITTNLRDVHFSDANNGGVFIGESGTIRRTINGGSTWTIVNSGTSSILFDLDFVNAGTAFIAGGNGTILKTSDGGVTWTPLTSGTTEFLYTVCFKNMFDGYVAGANGTVLKTTDGGATWTPEVSGVTDAINDLVYINGHFMAVTNSGKILTNEISSNVDISQIAANDFSLNLFPNPASNLVTIAFENTAALPVNVAVFNTTGSLVRSELLTENEQTFDVADLTDGVYFVHITTGELVIDKKLVIRK